MRKTFASVTAAASLSVAPPALSAECDCGGFPAACNEAIVVFEEEPTTSQKDAFEICVDNNGGTSSLLSSKGGIGERFYLAKFAPSSRHDDDIAGHISSLGALNGVEVAECNLIASDGTS